MAFKKMIVPFFVLFFLFVSASLSFAAIPMIIGYEGRLTDSSGTAITTPTQFTFQIWDVSAEGSGTDVKSSSTQTISPDANGVFSTVISVPDSNVFNGNDRWLGVTVGTDSEMIPRIRIASAPYAYMALNGSTPSYTNPTSSLGASVGAGDNQVGGTVSSTALTWSISPGSDTVTSISLTGSNGFSYTPASNSGSTSDSGHSYQYDNKPTYTLTVNYQTSAAQHPTASIGFYYVKYYGASTDDPPTTSDITSMTSAVASGRTLAATPITVAPSGQHLCYAYPQAYGVSNPLLNFYVDTFLVQSWTQTTATITHGTADVPYYVYTDDQTNHSDQILEVR